MRSDIKPISYPWPFDNRPKRDKSIKDRVAKSISESLSAESESFANYLATKLMREFNVTLKD